MMDLVRRYIFGYANLGRKAYCYRKGSEIMEKLHSSKTCLKMVGAGMPPPHPPWIRLCPH